MTAFTIRPAQRNDTDLAVAVFQSSMGGMADYLFAGLPRLSPQQALARLFQSDQHRFSWQFAHILEADGQAAGLLLSYPGRDLKRLQLALFRQLPALFGWSRTLSFLQRTLALLTAIEARADEYYISNIGILPALRGRGIGAQLMAFAEEQAHLAGLQKCSLAVDEHNTGAIRFYERLGYQIVFSHHFTGKVAQYESGYHRMVKLLSR
ncbi:MAG: GNAT family N-acetyltransferase [Anaerolineae bacterium]